MSGPETETHELVHERRIDATPAHVWQVMTERIAEWWCPLPWRAQFDRAEWRNGGAFDSTMLGPNGEVVTGSGIFLLVDAPRRFVFTDAISSDLAPQMPFMIGDFSIADDGAGGTLYRASARHWSAEAMAQHRDMGFGEGWAAAAAQLAALCEGDKA